MVPTCSWGGRFAVLLGATDKVKAVVMNHGSFVIQENIEAIKVPLLINGADKDRQISREMLAQFQGVLDCKKDVPSDVKVLTVYPVLQMHCNLWQWRRSLYNRARNKVEHTSAFCFASNHPLFVFHLQRQSMHGAIGVQHCYCVDSVQLLSVDASGLCAAV